MDVVDTWYSSRGNEMKVYAPTNEPLVLVAGDAGDRQTVDRALNGPSAAIADDSVATSTPPPGADLPR